MGKHVFLIDNEISRIAQIECLIAGTQITFSTAHNKRTASPMLYSEEIDLVAMSGSVSGSAPLLNKLLDLKNAKGTLLLLYPILNREARTEFYRRGFDMCVASEDPAECAAAISVMLQRLDIRMVSPGVRKGEIVYKGLFLDPSSQEVKLFGSPIELTTQEFRILYLLASNRGNIFSRDHIYEVLWKDSAYCGGESISNHICSIRKKLGLPPSDKEYIRTIHGSGYVFGFK